MDKPENNSKSSDLSGNKASSPGSPSVPKPSIVGARAVSPSGTSSQPGSRASGSISQLGNRGAVRAPVGRASGSFASANRSGSSQPTVPPRTASSSINMRLPANRSIVKPAVSDSAKQPSGDNKQPSGDAKQPSDANKKISSPNAQPATGSGQTAAPPKANSAESENPIPEELKGMAETVMLSQERFDADGNPLPPDSDEELSEDPEIEAGPVATLPVGMTIDGRYEIQGVLGVGGFATVYRAHHISLDTDVALKVMDTKKGVDATYSERFFREAKIAAKIRHNNVVSVYDYGHIPETDQPYIAMEMLHGRDLSHELADVGPLSPKRAFILFRPVLEALSVGHKLGIVHKDLKPENLYLIDPGGAKETMKILDFGVARVNSSEVAKLTTAGQLLGTPRYLAPEYIKSQQVSPAIDVYQMALIISEALTGIPAVTGDPFHAMMLHCSGKLQISEFLLEGRLGEIFRKAIAINPEERYPDCESFAKALDTVADLFSSNVPLQGGAPQMIPDAGVSANFSGLNSASGVFSGSYPQQSSKKPLILVIISVLLILGIGGGIFYKFRQKSQAELRDAERRAAEAAAAANKDAPNPEFNFTFKSIPEKAEVRLKGLDDVLCTTPCERTFKRTDMPALLTFSLAGYETSELSITELLHDAQKGIVSVSLDKVAAEVKKLPFLLKFSPKGATITDPSGDVVCKLSPCSYDFDPLKNASVTLTVSASGFKPQNIILTEAVYKESSTININLEPNKKTTGNTTQPQQPQQPKVIVVQQPVVQPPVKEKKKVKLADEEL